jgi:hypothetical protein
MISFEDVIEEEYQTNIHETIDTLQYGDIIEINKETFTVQYIDGKQIELVKKDKTVIVYELKEGYFYFQKKRVEIEYICLLFRNSLNGYAKQQHLDEGVSIVLIFEKQVFIKGTIMKVVNDSITVNTLTEGQLFIDFAYKGFKQDGLIGIELLTDDDKLVEEEEEEEEKEEQADPVVAVDLKQKMVFSKREQQEDLFFDYYNESNNLDETRSLLTRFCLLQEDLGKDAVVDSKYLVVTNKLVHNEFLKVSQDIDIYDTVTNDIERLLKEEDLLYPTGMLMKPIKEDDSTLFEAFVPLMAKSFKHLELRPLEIHKKIVNQIVSVKGFQTPEDFQWKEKQFVHFIPKKEFLSIKDYEAFKNQIIPSLEAKLSFLKDFQGPITCFNILQNYLKDPQGDFAIMKGLISLLKKRKAKIFYDNLYKYQSKETKKTLLPTKTILKSFRDELLDIKKRTDAFNISFELIINEKTFDLKEYFPGKDTNAILSFQEVLSQMLKNDNAKCYTTFLGMQNVVKPSLKDYIKTVMETLKEEKSMECQNIVIIAKTYSSTEQVLADNNKTIYFDEDLLDETPAASRQVEDGHFAIVRDETKGPVYMKRINSKWERYENVVSIKDIILSNTSTFCELQPNCVKLKNDCQSIDHAQRSLNKTLLLHMQTELNSEHEMTLNEIMKEHEIALKSLNKQVSENTVAITPSNPIHTVLFKVKKLYSSDEIFSIIKNDMILKDYWFICLKTLIPHIPVFVYYWLKGNQVKFENYQRIHFIQESDVSIDTKSGYTFANSSICNNLLFDTCLSFQKSETIYLEVETPFDWSKVLLQTFVPDAIEADQNFLFYFCQEELEEQQPWMQLLSCIFVIKQTKFLQIESWKSELSLLYKGYPFYSSDFKDNEGLERFGNEFYLWLESKNDLKPFDILKTFFQFVSNKKLFIETFAKNISLHLSNHVLNHPVYLQRVIQFRKELQQKTKKDKKYYFRVTNWERFMPQLNKLHDFKYQVSGFVLKGVITPEMLYIKSLLLSIKYMQDFKNVNDETVKAEIIKGETVKGDKLSDSSFYIHLFQDIDKKINEIRYKSCSYLFYAPDNTEKVYEYGNSFSEETIYRSFIKYCKFNNNCPLYKKLADICDAVRKKSYTDEDDIELETSESYNNRRGIEFSTFDEIDLKIEKLKENGRRYNEQNMHQLLNYIHDHTKVAPFQYSFSTRQESLNTTLLLAQEIYPEDELFKNSKKIDIENEIKTKMFHVLEYLGEKQLDKKKKLEEEIITTTVAATFYHQFNKTFKREKSLDESKRQLDLTKEVQNKLEKQQNEQRLITEMRNSLRTIVVTIPLCIINKHSRKFEKFNVRKYFDDVQLESKMKLLKDKGKLFVDLFEFSDPDLAFLGYYFLSLFELFINIEITVSMAIDFSNLFFSSDEINAILVNDQQNDQGDDKRNEKVNEKVNDEVSEKVKDKVNEIKTLLILSHEEKEVYETFGYDIF